jgi:ParB/Sulfiredoxin domain
VNFDPAGSEQAPATDIREFEADVVVRQARVVVRETEDVIALDERRARADFDDDDYERDDEREDEADEPAPAAAAREGLPARFRMRHTLHYVDELLGEAPLRTVREIPLSEIELPTEDRAQLEDLERSIRRLGVIEPLLVGRRGACYRVIAGMRRLRAAHRLALNTVPCLVHDADEDRLAEMRRAVIERTTELRPEPAPAPATAPPRTEPSIGEAALGIEFVSALLPALNAAGRDRLRWGVLTDLAAVELSRTKAVATAHELLRSDAAIERSSADHLALVSDVVSAVSTEARLRRVTVDLELPDSARDILFDGARCREVLRGLLQCLLTLAPRTGTVLSVRAQITTIRPALVVDCLLRECDPEPSAEALARFFEAGWREHPCGPDGGSILAALAQTARAHGGRAGVKAAANGCLITFVVPRVEG